MSHTRVISALVLLGALIAADRCYADPLSVASGYAVLYEGTGNHNFSFNNGTISGNIGIGGTNPQLQLSGGAANTIIDGNVLFNGTKNNTGTAGTDYTITAGHTITGGNSAVQTVLNSVNNLSVTYFGETATSLTMNIGNGTQTVDASAGVLDATGNRVFNVTSFSFNNGATLTIDGKNLGQSVILNFGINAQFGGIIALTGGLTADQVLFNFNGGRTLQINTNGATETGIFLNPDGNIQMNHSVLNGRLFGGDSQDMAIVSGGSIFAPTVPTPEPSTIVIGAAMLCAFGFYKLKMFA